MPRHGSLLGTHLQHHYSSFHLRPPHHLLKLHSERGAAGDYGNQSGGGQSGGGQPAGGQAGGGSTNDLLHSDRSRLLAPSRIGHNNHHHHGRHGQVKDARLADYSEEELAEYRAVFNIFDTDRSGAIGLDELEAAMKNLGLEPTQEQLELIIDEVDQIGNHEIDFPEFCDVMRRLTAKKSTINEIVHQCFEVFDRSESGAISKKDFAIILRELGDISDNSIIDEIFAEADVDGSGSIDYEEFTYMVRQYMTDEDLNT